MIAVLITCHNRKAQTIACLARLFTQTSIPAGVLNVYLVDDGCTDGTAQAVQEGYPSAKILKGDGALFWCNGMRLAWEHAAKTDPDFYLWLNDDTMLRAQAVETLIGAAQEVGNPACIVVGSACDSASGAHTYGGQNLLGWHPARLTLVEPDALVAKTCDTAHGNCVLVTRAAYRVLGTMRSFRHQMGDTDYGLRARQRGIPVLLAPGFVAECSANPPAESWRNREIPWAQRFRMLAGRKGLPPGDWWRYLWAHARFRALICWPVPYLRVLVGR
jgi:GT2 family glycosyltransferase